MGRNPDSNPKSKFSLRSFNLGVGRNPDSNPRSEKFHFYGGYEESRLKSNSKFSTRSFYLGGGVGTGIQTQVQSLSFFLTSLILHEKSQLGEGSVVKSNHHLQV